MAAYSSIAIDRWDSKQSSEFRPSFAMLLALFSIELLALNLARLPESMRFDGFAFCDHGSNLTLQYLISHGYRAGIDFGYHYGLLPALFGRVWFAALGPTPWSYQFAMISFNLVCAWALAKTFVQIRIGGLGLIFTTIGLGFAFQPTYPNLAHAMEAALIVSALAQQASGAKTIALAITSATVFAKPSMAYAYSLLLILLIVRDLTKESFSPRRWLLAFAPAAVTFLTVAMVLSIEFGASVLLRTAVPIEGAAAYRALNFGLFADGRGLWDAKAWPFYFITHSGFWIAANLFLYGCATSAIIAAIVSRELPTRRAGLVITCAVLHLCFLFAFFGNQFSWIYYSYLLVIGCAVAVDFGPYHRRLGLALSVLAFFSWTALGYWTLRWWATTTPTPSTKGLWARRDERAEWETVLAIAGDHKVTILDEMGAAELLFPGFQQPVSLFLMKGLMTQGDISRKLRDLAVANTVVVPLTKSTCTGIASEPEFNHSLGDFSPVWKGQYFEIFQRHLSP